jgi:hypothetical protein
MDSIHWVHGVPSMRRMGFGITRAVGGIDPAKATRGVIEGDGVSTMLLRMSETVTSSKGLGRTWCYGECARHD